ncbi:MAG: extracellular solute-binding protein, partial [Actinomycetota bacterium]|nr:extracellular solute-binding protein [Actinomycetota bacterium]
CGGSSAGSGPTITLYNSQHEQTTAALIKEFTKQTGINVRVLNNSEDVLTAQLVQEGSRSPADVFYTENSNWLQQLADRGLLSKVDGATLANVPRPDSAANGDWVGVSARVSAVVYNPTRVSPAQLPKSVMDLANPQWKGKIELAPAETDFWPVVSSIARTHGQAAALAWLRALKGNAGSNDSVPDNETVVSDVSKGVAGLGLINHYYFYRLRAELGQGAVHAELAYFAPRDPGYVEDISGAAVLKSSQHQAAAQKFVAFLTSDRGQAVLAHSESFEYPIHSGVAPNPILAPFSRFQPSSFTPAELGTGLDAERLLRAAGLI